MADDLADIPIVILENDYPERIGRIGLFDYRMNVVGSGLWFVAAVPGILQPYGVDFEQPVKDRANLRAAMTLIHMGLLDGRSFRFSRMAINWTVEQTAAQYGVTVQTLLDWEGNLTVIPRAVWECLSYRVSILDGGVLEQGLALNPSWRPRTIRVFPNWMGYGPMGNDQVPPECCCGPGKPNVQWCW